MANSCETACTKWDTCAASGARCEALDIDCTQNPPHPERLIQCALDCLASDDSSCADIGAYFDGTSLAGPGSEFIQCMATCDPNPVHPCFSCLAGSNGEGGGGGASSGYCFEHLTCLGGGGAGGSACDEWVSCVTPCRTPSCFTACNNAHSGAASDYDPFYNCVCNDIPDSEAVQIITGQGRCVDACTSFMDACNQ
jgi:hypothetical protein